MTDDAYDVRSEARGPHWVAWVVRGNEARPAGSVLLVGQTQEEAERRARDWAGQYSTRFGIYSSDASPSSGSSGSPSRSI